jgi:YD repeat-containing protein
MKVLMTLATLLLSACPVGNYGTYRGGYDGEAESNSASPELDVTPASGADVAPTQTTPARRPGEAAPGTHYDGQGRLSGRVDDDGRSYDEQGRYAGRSDGDGRRYDDQGRYAGRTDENGNHYDGQGRSAGRTDSDGRSYDAQGRYAGRVDADGRRYDAQGRYVGRVD